MDVITYSDARKNFKNVLDKVVDDCSEVLVTRRNGEPVVMMSLASWQSFSETDYLLSNEANRARLLRGVEEFAQGKVSKRELIKP